jgi:hypothetical protein
MPHFNNVVLRNQTRHDPQQFLGLIAPDLLDGLHAVLGVPFHQVLEKGIPNLVAMTLRTTRARYARIAFDKLTPAGEIPLANLLGFFNDKLAFKNLRRWYGVIRV